MYIKTRWLEGEKKNVTSHNLNTEFRRTGGAGFVFEHAFPISAHSSTTPRKDEPPTKKGKEKKISKLRQDEKLLPAEVQPLLPPLVVPVSSFFSPTDLKK